MSKFYIEIDEKCPADRINLSPSQVDTFDYDNNRGYNVFALSILGGEEEQERLYFPSRESMEDFMERFNLQAEDSEWEHDVDGWHITQEEDDGSTHEIDCLCDVLVTTARFEQ